jgi:uncharacterized protein
MRIEQLYRYPVKGLSAEALDEATVAPGGTLPWDRAFALAQGDAPFDPAAPTWLQKGHFMCLMRNAKIARLRAGFDLVTKLLTVRAPDGAMVTEPVLEPEGRARVAAFLTAFLGPEARGTPQFHHVPGHVFGDQRRPAVSLINLASLAAFEEAVGAPRDRMRFRANIYFTGPAWSEFTWVGQTITVGGTRLLVTKRIVRCPATEVNPATAERDANPVAELRLAYGHTDMGVHAEVVEGGRLAVGNAIRLDEEPAQTVTPTAI